MHNENQHTDNLTVLNRQFSDDNLIGKYVFSSPDKQGSFETGSFISKDKIRHDICISSMAGCNMQCKICSIPISETPFERLLQADEFVKQITHVIRERITAINNTTIHAVGIMGNGEPFNNFNNMIDAIIYLNNIESHINHISISTMGRNTYAFKDLAEIQKHVSIPINLQYSLITLTEDIRNQLVPYSAPLQETIQHLDAYAEETGQPVKYNIPLIKGINNTHTAIMQIIKFANENQQTRLIKLSTFNPFPGIPYPPVPDFEIDEIANYIRKNNLNVKIFKADRDENVFASCGQLRHNSDI